MMGGGLHIVLQKVVWAYGGGNFISGNNVLDQAVVHLFCSLSLCRPSLHPAWIGTNSHQQIFVSSYKRAWQWSQPVILPLMRLLQPVLQEPVQVLVLGCYSTFYTSADCSLCQCLSRAFSMAIFPMCAPLRNSITNFFATAVWMTIVPSCSWYNWSSLYFPGSVSIYSCSAFV